ncbi:MAG: hypothetical protein ABEJ06_06645 [Haloarculaceae archaeon]
MASESTEGSTVTVSLPSDLEEWLDERAAERDVDRETVLRQLLAAYRVVVDAEEGSTADALASDVGVEGRVDEQLAPVQQRLDELEQQMSNQFEEVQRRLVQVKQEVDEKAPADHTHDRLERLPAVVEELDDLDSTVAALEARLDSADYETRLDGLESDAEQVRSRLETVARAVVGLRSRVTSLRASRQEVLTRIRQRAAAEDVEKARCENCEKLVTVALLAEPVCPHCGADLAALHPSERLFFGTATLETDRPQLAEAPE